MNAGRKLVPHLLRGDESRKRAQDTKPKLHERITAKALGGRVTPASGAIEGIKGDVDGVEHGIFEFLVECKRTEKKSLRIEVRWLDKISREARSRAGRYPAIAMQFEHTEEAESDWIAVPRSAFIKMLESAEASTEGI